MAKYSLNVDSREVGAQPLTKNDTVVGPYYNPKKKRRLRKVKRKVE